MNNNECGDNFFDADVKIEEMIWLAGCVANPSDAFCDFVRDEDPKDIKRLLGIDLKDEPDPDPEEVITELARKNRLGFLLRFYTPIPEHIAKDRKSWVQTWGYCRTEWFYVDQLETAAVHAQHWRDAVLEAEKKKQQRKKLPPQQEKA